MEEFDSQLPLSSNSDVDSDGMFKYFSNVKKLLFCHLVT